MNKTQKIIKDGKWRLHATVTDKFKISRFSFNFILPKDKVRSPMTKLMLSVMMRGSESYPTITDINKSLDELYDSTVSLRSLSFGDKCVFSISCKILENKYRLAGDETDSMSGVFGILSDIIYRPLKDDNGYLLSQYVESEKNIQIDAINAQINDQRAYASRQCNKLMFEGTPYSYSVSGDVETVSGFTPKDLTENIEFFLKNARVECYYIGSENIDTVEELLLKHFDFTASPEIDVQYAEKAFESNREDVLSVSEDMDVSQGRLELGYTCGVILSDRESYAAALFNEIWGGASVSKLFMNVREKKSLCYYCYSSYHSATGTVNVGCGIKPENRDVALAEIAHQLDEMKNGNFTDEEIQTAKRTVISGYKQISDSCAGIESFSLRRLIAGVDHSESDCIELISSVTREDILAIAQRVKLDTVYFLNGMNGQYEEDKIDE